MHDVLHIVCLIAASCSGYPVSLPSSVFHIRPSGSTSLCIFHISRPHGRLNPSLFHWCIGFPGLNHWSVPRPIPVYIFRWSREVWLSNCFQICMELYCKSRVQWCFTVHLLCGLESGVYLYYLIQVRFYYLENMHKPEILVYCFIFPVFQSLWSEIWMHLLEEM